MHSDILFRAHHFLNSHEVLDLNSLRIRIRLLGLEICWAGGSRHRIDRREKRIRGDHVGVGNY
jgi:hypothetical protein